MSAKHKPASKSEVCQPKKRTNVEVHNTTAAEEIGILGDQIEVLAGEISTLRQSLKTVLTKSDVEQIVTANVSKLLKEMEARMKTELEAKLKDQTKELNEKIEALQFENNELKDKFKILEKSTEANKESAKEELAEINSLAKKAMKKANYNEQYSRKKLH